MRQPTRNMKRIMLEITPELFEALEHARDGAPRNAYIERQLWRTKGVRDGAERAGVEDPKRPEDGRGLRAPD